jgi:AcrR family transcriptional regulator
MTNVPRPHDSRKMIRLLETAKGLFLRHGFKRVTIGEICQKSRVSKMTFYRYFPNKTALARSILRQLFAEERSQITSVMSTDLPFEEKITRTLLYKMDFTTRFSQESMDELVEGGEVELREVLEEENGKTMREFRTNLLAAQSKGEIRSDLGVDFILLILNKTRQIIADPSLREQFPDVTALMKDVFTLFFYGLLRR